MGWAYTKSLPTRVVMKSRHLIDEARYPWYEDGEDAAERFILLPENL